MSRLQVVLSRDALAPVVAGLPSCVRAAFRAGKEVSPERIVIEGADPEFLEKWDFQLRAAGAPVAADGLDPAGPILRVEPGAFPDERGLADFLAAAEPLGAAKGVLNGQVVASYARNAAALAEPAAEIPAAAFFNAGTQASAAAARRILYSRMSKQTDGYIARFDRKVSLAVTSLLLPYPVTPNEVTAVSLVIGLIGAWWLAAPSQRTQFLGALTLWFCAVLDGCDGEIARLKHHVTPHGGDFDLLADHIAHLATFVALPVGVARLHPGTNWMIPGTLLVTGFLASGYGVWRLVLRVPEDQRGPQALVVERLAGRDYVYLILACTALGRLDLFVSAAAVGSHVFWIWLWWSTRAQRTQKYL